MTAAPGTLRPFRTSGSRPLRRELAGGCGAFAPASTTQVYRRAILDQVQQAGTDIQANAADPRIPVTSVLRGTEKLLAAAEHDLRPEHCHAPHRQAEVLPLPSRQAIRGQARHARPEVEWEAAQ